MINQRGYIGLISILVTVAIIGLLYTMKFSHSNSGSATSTPTKVGQSTIEQDIQARDSAEGVAEMSAKRAAEINAQMQF